MRALARRPAFTALAVLTLAIGLGVNTVAFSAVNALAFKPLRFAGADAGGWLFVASARDPQSNASLPAFDAIARQATTLRRVAAEGRMPVAFDRGDGTEQIWALVTSPDYFSIVDPTPLVGRLLNSGDGLGDDVAVLLSARFWQRQFGGTPDLGRLSVTINRQPARVVGVIPDGFQGPGGIFEPDVWVPLAARHALALPARYDDPAVDWLTVVAQPATDASREAIAREIAQIVADARLPVGGVDPSTEAGAPALRVEYVPFADRHPEARQIATVAVLGLGAVGLVLLIACFNVAGLTLARVVERRHDLSVRAALGASRWRLARLTLTEGLVLASAGAAAALMLAYWSGSLLSVFSLPAPIPQRLHFSTDWRVIAFTVALGLISALLPALTPMIQLWRADLACWLRSSGTAQGGGFSQRRTRRVFVVLQVAGSTAFLTLALIFGGHFVSQWRVDPGFDAGHLAILELDPAQHGYDGARGRDLTDRLLAALQRTPGVRAAAVTDRVPFFVGGPNVSRIAPDGRDCAAEDCPRAGSYVADDRFFDAMGMPLVAGRLYRAADPGDRDSVVISQTAARTLWPAASAIGRTFRIETSGRVVTVVGVVADIIHRMMNEPAQPYYYRPAVDADYAAPFTVVVRTSGDPAGMLPDIRLALRGIDPGLPPRSLQTMDARMALPLWGPRTAAGFFGTCGAVAVLLSTIGLFGVMYFSVHQRRREFGVRLALGATRRDVQRLVVIDALRLAWPGIAIGTTMAAALALVLRSLLLGLETSHPLPYVAAALVQCAVTMMASWSPAMRAARSSPLEVLRSE